MSNDATRLSRLTRQYADMPPAVLLKTDLIFNGIDINQALIDAGTSAMPHFRRVEFGGQPRVIPYFIHIPDGAGGELLVLVRPVSGAPYALRPDGAGGHRLMEGNRVLGPVRPHPRPAWYLWAEKMGFRRATTGLNQHGDMLVANLSPACEYWRADGETDELRCLFCGYGAVSERSASLGQKRGVAEIAAETLAEWTQTLPRARAESRHLYLVGGSMRERDEEGRRYLSLVRAAVAADPSYRGAICCGSQALPGAWSRRIRDVGAGYACFNLEVWDPALWSALCPGKARFVGREQWLQDMLDAVDIFGRGAVLSAFVAGAELVPPLGLSTPEQAIESNTAGAEWLLSRGIVPIHSPLSPTIASEYSRAAAPAIDYFLRLNRATFELRRRHKFPMDPRFVCSGCCYAQIECDLDRLAGILPAG